MMILLCLFLQEPDLQGRLVRAWNQTGPAEPALMESAFSSSDFGARYVSALLQVRETLVRGDRHERCYQRLASLGGSPGAADHVRALAASFKAAVYCRECKVGKVSCAQCGGKKRTEVKCHVCEGKGRVGAPGAVDKSQVTQKCRNCDGKAVFRDVRCPSCAGTGVNDCGKCLGSPWHDRACAAKECRNGRVACASCRGKGRIEPQCPTCQGRGRVGAPGAIDPSQVTQRCNDCDGRGTFKEKQNCPACDGSPVGMGYVKCTDCGRKPAVADLSAVFDTEPCAPCAKCFGLGFRVRPSADPAKLLE